MAPVTVSGLPGANAPVHLLGVWAQNASEGHRQKDNPGFLQRALRRYRRFLRAAPAVVAGDFNNHVQWDRAPDGGSTMPTRFVPLARLGLVSAYHVSRGVEAGNEPEPTFYWRRRAVDGYHIDYVFMPKDWSAHAFDVMVGKFEDWIGSGPP